MPPQESGTSGQPSDWPEGGFEVHNCKCEYVVSDQICEECEGTRNAVTHVFKMTIQTVAVHGEEMDWAEFRKRYPITGERLHQSLHLGEFVNPTCVQCQEDMRVRMKHLLGENGDTAEK